MDTAPVVQHPGLDQGAGGADPHASVAASAGLLKRLVGLELGRGHDLGQQDVGTNPRDEQVGVLSQPAQPGASRRRAIEHPAVVDVGLRHVTSLAQHRDQRLHPVEQDLVVVAPEGVGGDAALSAPTLPSPASWGGKLWVWKGEGDHAAGVRCGPSGVGTGMRPSLAPPGEPVHQALLGPVHRSGFGQGKSLRAGHAHGAEAELGGPPFDLLRQGHLTLA